MSGVLVLYLLLDLLLMSFCVVAVVLAQPALAAIAGTASVSLSTKLARRLLRGEAGGRRRGRVRS